MQMTFWNASFFIFKFLSKFPWSLFRGVQLTISPLLCHQLTCNYLNQCWPIPMAPYSMTRPQWVKYAMYIISQENKHITQWNFYNAAHFHKRKIKDKKKIQILCVCKFTVCIVVLSHWGWDKMANILQIPYLNPISSMKIVVFWFKFHSKGPTNNMLSLVQIRTQGTVSLRKTVFPGMAIPMLKIRRPNGRLIFNMEISIRR